MSKYTFKHEDYEKDITSLEIDVQDCITWTSLVDKFQKFLNSTGFTYLNEEEFGKFSEILLKHNKDSE